MRFHFVWQSHLLAGQAEGPAKGGVCEVIGFLFVGEQPSGMAVRAPEVTHGVQHNEGEWNDSLFVAFADNPKTHLLGVDARNRKGDDFAGAETARIHQ